MGSTLDKVFGLHYRWTSRQGAVGRGNNFRQFPLFRARLCGRGSATLPGRRDFRRRVVDYVAIENWWSKAPLFFCFGLSRSARLLEGDDPGFRRDRKSSVWLKAAAKRGNLA